MRGRGSLLLAGAAGVALVAVGGWYVFLRGEAPPPVSLEVAVQQAQASPTEPRATASVVAATIPTALPSAAPPGATPAATSPPPRTDGRPEGKWAVDRAASFVGYRMVEQLASVGANTAVGRTSAVSGELSFDGRSVTALRVTADMRQLRSDEQRRDTFLRGQSLQTDRFPEAVFVLAEPIPVSTQPTEGATLIAAAKGDLTLHGVTKRVEVPVEGRLAGGKLIVVGSLRVTLADYAIAPPRAPVVLSVEDAGVMELSLVFAPAGG